MADDTPAYFRLYYDVWQAVRSLPRAKAAKLLYAMADYFFEGTEPDEGELPVAAQRMFDIQKASIASYRRNALNGCRNRRNRTKNDPKTVSKPTSKTVSKTTPKTDTVLKGSQEGLPAETQKVGHKHSGKHSGKSASNIINHESLISSPPPALLPSAEQSRAAVSRKLRSFSDRNSFSMPSPPRNKDGNIYARGERNLPVRQKRAILRKKEGLLCNMRSPKLSPCWTARAT